ncbi:hypothetical protein CPAV1605_765 [seawater metagenome]|uniref:Uncharacterized protein n=1 Tax=seawater metagenome TaxID=1561972 RepID=A0A5E8CMC1_9ZZZZ
MKNYSLSKKLYFKDNYIKINRIYFTPIYTIGLTNSSTLILENNKTFKLNQVFRKVDCQNRLLLGICPYDNFEEEIQIIDLKLKKKVDGLMLNLEKNTKVMDAFLDRHIITIILNNGIIYSYNRVTKIVDTILSCDLFSFSSITKSSQGFKILASQKSDKKIKKIISVTSGIYQMKTYKSNTTAEASALCQNMYYLGMVIGKEIRILKQNNRINDYEYILTIIPDTDEIIKTISFHPKIHNIILINFETISQIVIFDEKYCKDKYRLFEKFNNNLIHFSNKGEIIKIINNHFELYEPNINYKKSFLNQIRNIKEQYQNSNSNANHKTNLALYHQENLPYDYVLECKNIDYQKRLHGFILFSKLNPGILNDKRYNKNRCLNLNLQDIEPTHETIDEFIKYLYTDILPSSEVIVKDIDFYCHISKQLLPLSKNSLLLWSNFIRNYCNLNYII